MGRKKIGRQIKHLSLRIEPKPLYKFRYIADFNGRSANRQLLHMIYSLIKDFEEEHGTIEVPQELE